MKSKTFLEIFPLGEEMLKALTSKLQLPILVGVDGTNPSYMASCWQCSGSCMGDCEGGCMGDCYGGCLGCDSSCEGYNR